MSLFKVCTWWSVQCQDILDNYDSASLLCCRFGLNNTEKDYIIVGSHTGHLSIFYPTSEMTEEGNFKGYKPTNLLLETKLKASVLGFTAGRFSGSPKNENNNQLAVLHPFSLCIYNLSTVDGVAEHGTHSNLQILVEHKFKRSAFSVCKGHFGRVKGREFLCVLHMDSTLTFFEQDGIIYECTLPGYKTLPSVLAYLPRTDSFVRVNSCWELESFSYQDLSQSGINKSTVTPTWSVCIGEYAIDICSAQITNSKTAIMILGEHNLINISDDGKVQYVIRLDYSPKCFCCFVIGWYWEPNTRLITAVVSDSSSLLIYDDGKLIWAAHLEEVPVAIQRSNLENLAGGIVTLGSKGLLHVGFLGAEPSVFKVPPLNLQEMNFEKSQKELIELEKEIKQGIDLTDVEMVNSSVRNDLELDFDVCAKPTTDENLKSMIGNERYISMYYSASVKFKTRINLDQIQIAISASDGIKCSQPISTFNNIAADSFEVIEVSFHTEDRLHVATAEVEVIASFINKQSIPRVLIKKAFLPLTMFYENVPPQKDASIKVTLTINTDKKSNIHKLSTIYPEFCEDNDMQALGLGLLYTEEVVTVVAAKNTNRFRIQSDSLEAIPLVLEAMINYAHSLEQLENNRKKEKGRRGEGKSKILVAAPNIPMAEVLERIENHYKVQKDIKAQTVIMDALWNQFKLFQRSLQSKSVEDVVDGIMMLIEKNYDDLVIEGDNLVNLRNNEQSKRNNLSCAIAIVRHIITCMELEYQTIESLLCTLYIPVEDWAETSWEETVAPAFDMLNHQGPLCRKKTAPLDTNPSFSTAVHFEFDRFKRHMTSLMDRACRLATDQKQRQQILAPSTRSKNSQSEMGMDQSIGKENFEKTLVDTKSESQLKALQDHDDADDDDHGVEEAQGKYEKSDWLSSEIPSVGIPALGQGTKLF